MFFIIAPIKRETTIKSPAYVYLLQTVLQTKKAHEGVTDFLFFIIALIKKETTIKSPAYDDLLQTVSQAKDAHEGMTAFWLFIITQKSMKIIK